MADTPEPRNSIATAISETSTARPRVVTIKCGHGTHDTIHHRGAKPSSSFRAEPHGGRSVHSAVHGVAHVSSVMGDRVGQAQRRAAQEVALGTNAKSSAARGQVDPETGEILGLPKDSAMARFERFALQSAARKLLPKSRTDKCLHLRSKGQQIQVLKSKEHKTAMYTGLQTCGSVWACPVCAAKISERRRLELLSAMTAHQAQGGQVWLATFTTPHHLGDDLAEVLAGQAKALSYLNGDRASRKLFAQMGCIGSVRALEVTHGRKRAVNNGWHPHYHVLLFVARDLALEDFRAPLYDRWLSACTKAGVKPPSYEHGVRLDDGSKAAAYASKWGLESEMTKGHIKKAMDGETPFDFLRAYLEDTDKQAGALFIEFATVFKGKRQLFWSKGLKARFKIGEKNDEELAAEQDDHAVLLGTITLEQWRAVLKNHARATVLQLAERLGWEAAVELMDSMLKTTSEREQRRKNQQQLKDRWKIS